MFTMRQSFKYYYRGGAKGGNGPGRHLPNKILRASKINLAPGRQKRKYVSAIQQLWKNNFGKKPFYKITIECIFDGTRHTMTFHLLYALTGHWRSLSSVISHSNNCWLLKNNNNIILFWAHAMCCSSQRASMVNPSIVKAHVYDMFYSIVWHS